MDQNTLTINQEQKLEHLEGIIERGLDTFIEVGNALTVIRDEHLYKAQYTRFEDYCLERWGMSRPRAYQLIEASGVHKNLSTIVDKTPKRESQIRPLVQLEPSDQVSAWNEVLEQNPNGHITAEKVAKVASNYKRDTKANREGNLYEPKGYDLCQTPDYAIDPLLMHLYRFQTIWEPAAGEGNLVGALYDSGYDVKSSDIQTGENFFDYQPDQWDCLVTNPPYSIKYKWLERCYELGKPFALLMPVEMLGAATAQKLFSQFGIEIILLDKRVNFKMPNKGWDGGGAQFPVAWYTWGFQIGQQLTFAQLEHR